ncbi:MAG: hypothetical protein MJZ21_00125 [archaeon]|nr:hypothetical protein [archaeon]
MSVEDIRLVVGPIARRFRVLRKPALQWQSLDNTVLDIDEYFGTGA